MTFERDRKQYRPLAEDNGSYSVDTQVQIHPAAIAKRRVETVDSTLLSNTQDHELEGIDFSSPVEAMGAQAAKVTTEITQADDETMDEPHERWGFGD